MDLDVDARNAGDAETATHAPCLTSQPAKARPGESTHRKHGAYEPALGYARLITPNPIPAPRQPPKKSGTSGCLIALGIIGAILAIFCIIGGVVFWRASQSEEGKKVFSAIGKGVQIAGKGLNALGAAELREAGCPQAFVLDSGDVMGVVELFIDGGSKMPVENETLVMCQGNVLDDLPDCEKLAAVYIAAAHPKNPFSITVNKQGRSKPVCQGRYGPDGKALEPR